MELQRLLDVPGALPSIPRVVALVLHELNQEPPDLIRISSLLAREPMLTAQLLRVANSARYQMARRICTVNQAMTVLGLAEIRDIALLAAVSSAFRRVGTVDMRQFWRYSLNTARLTRHLARNRGALLRRNTVSAQTVALVHALGELVLHLGMPQKMAALDERVHVFAPERAQAEHEILGYSFAQVGGAFARAWQLPETLALVVDQHDAPFTRGRYEPMAGLLHMAAWRCRTRELGLSERDLIETYPDTTALALRLDYEEVLSLDPVPWAGEGEIEALAA